MEHCKESLSLQKTNHSTLRNESKTLKVILISLVTMIAEISFGLWTESMALLADGWHMGSHVAALFLSFIVYKLARSESFHSHFTFGSSKLYALGGFTSSLILAFIAVFMAYESIQRLFHPSQIHFNEALLVSMVGLIVNLVSAWILNDDHSHHDHDHEHIHEHDHNRESALAHVLADALTSIAAIFALLMGKYFQIGWLDPAIGILGAIIIVKWSYSLITKTAYELLDGKLKTANTEDLVSLLESDGGKVIDLHIWSVGAGKVAGIASIETQQLLGAQHYHAKMDDRFDFSHLVIEEIKKP